MTKLKQQTEKLNTHEGLQIVTKIGNKIGKILQLFQVVYNYENHKKAGKQENETQFSHKKSCSSQQ